MKSFYKLYDTCCSQKLQNDEKIRHWWRHKCVKNVGYATTFWIIPTCLGDCTYQVSSPYILYNLLAVTNMSEKNTSGFMGVYTPPFSHLEERILKSKKFAKGGVHPHCILLPLRSHLLLADVMTSIIENLPRFTSIW